MDDTSKRQIFSHVTPSSNKLKNQTVNYFGKVVFSHVWRKEQETEKIDEYKDAQRGTFQLKARTSWASSPRRENGQKIFNKLGLWLVSSRSAEFKKILVFCGLVSHHTWLKWSFILTMCYAKVLNTLIIFIFCLQGVWFSFLKWFWATVSFLMVFFLWTLAHF